MGIGHNFLTPMIMMRPSLCTPPAATIAGPWPNTSPDPTSTSPPDFISFGSFFLPVPSGTVINIDLTEFFTGGPITGFSVSHLPTADWTLTGSILSATVTIPYNDLFGVTATSACGTADLNIAMVLIST